MFDLSRRVALVTGAGQGVGAEVARTLARQGAAVAVNDLFAARARTVADEIIASGGRAEAVDADITDVDAVGAMVATVEARVGPVDILVNNAGIPADGFALKQFRDTTLEDWEPFIRLNLYGTLHCTRAVVDGMCERGWGRVVTVSSEAGRAGTGLGISLYGASKAAAVGLSRHLAVELGPFGVTVNCVSLGVIERADGAGHGMVKGYPTRRLGRPADVAGAIAYLASDEAAWVTGQTLPVNGGIFTT
ncbi:MAG: SDR family oxidoreductase [Actinobacteria bacterium]|nr:MAG: SDR family oxidoreductase [Actinomycetota bacterium]